MLLFGASVADARATALDITPLERPEPRATGTLAAPAPREAAEPALARIGFAPDAATLDRAAVADLDRFAGEFRRRAGRVALKAYAGEPGDTGPAARRLSLKRVLAVREFLIGRGVSAERLDVRALGGTRDAGPPDRVDITRTGG